MRNISFIKVTWVALALFGGSNLFVLLLSTDNIKWAGPLLPLLMMLWVAITFAGSFFLDWVRKWFLVLLGWWFC